MSSDKNIIEIYEKALRYYASKKHYNDNGAPITRCHGIGHSECYDGLDEGYTAFVALDQVERLKTQARI